jgi:hypothetical protein
MHMLQVLPSATIQFVVLSILGGGVLFLMLRRRWEEPRDKVFDRGHEPSWDLLVPTEPRKAA